jgi:hypothetical protein
LPQPGAFVEVIPITGQQIALQIPAGKRVARIHLLVAAKDVTYRAEHDAILFETPSIGLHEVVAVDFA